MKSKKIKNLLALTLATVMMCSQPMSALASEQTGVEETVTEADTEETTTEESEVEESKEEESEVQETIVESTVETSETEQEIIQETTTEESSEVATTEETEISDVTTEESSEVVATEETSIIEVSTEESSEVSTTEEIETSEITTEEIETSEEITTEEETTLEANTIETFSDKELELQELGFETMSLSDDMRLDKESLFSVVSELKSMKSGEDYIENEVVYFADSEEMAKEIAKSYGGEVSDYEEGVAVASIEATVLDAVNAAADMDIDLPAVYPNIVYKISDDWDSVSDTENETETQTEIETLIDESDVVHDKIDEVQELQLPCEDEHLYAAKPSDPGYAKQWYHENMNTLEAWNASKGEGVVVAVIDSGIDYNHEDLKANIIGHDDTTGTSSTGYDGNGHGTHCAGIIAAAENGVGITGVAPKANIYSVKALWDDGRGKTADIVQGVKKATEKKVDVISMSLGGICYDAAFQKVINEAVNKGIVVVAAAGNESTSQKSYPAAYSNVISVAATDTNDTLTNFSNYGSWVDIAAPGYNIYSTVPKEYGKYDYMSGTSMACPAVAGTVALLISNNETLKKSTNKSGVTKITNALLKSAVPDAAESYYEYNAYPLVDAEATVYAVDENMAETPTIKFSAGEPGKGNTILAGEKEYFELKTTTPHSKIYYTINGKKPTAENGYLYTGKIYMPISGKIKIQAVTVVGSKTSKVFSKTYKFDVKTKSLSSSCAKEMNVVAGKSIQLSVDVYPYYASNKKFTWTSSDTDKKYIKVNNNGKVTCNKKAKAGATATITATTTDGTNKSYSFTVKVISEAIDGISLNAKELKMSYFANEANLNMKDYYKTFKLEPTSEGVKNTQYLYKSSNTKVATVDAQGNITAHAKGKANITVTANDGSGKKAICKVTVVTPIVDIYTYSSTGFSSYSDYIPIGTGCSVTMKPQINYNAKSGVYAPSNKKLKWSSDNNNVTVKNGKVTCKNDSSLIGKTVNITVEADDDFGEKQVIKFKVFDKIKKLTLMEYDEITENFVDTGKTSLSGYMAVGEVIPDLLYNGYINIHTQNDTYDYYNSFDIDTKNRDSVYRYYESGYGTVVIVGTKAGNSKITYTTRDGSNKKFTINIKVIK